MRSMTAFASRSGGLGANAWNWEIRSVNGRGLDLRLRLPEGVTGLEGAARGALQKRIARGSVTLSLRLTREAGEGDLMLDPVQLDRVLVAFRQITERAAALEVALGQPTAADVLAVRSVVATAPDEQAQEGAPLAPILADLEILLEEFSRMRQSEGAMLQTVIEAQLNEIERLARMSAEIAEARREETRAALSTALRRVIEEAPEIDEARVAQELALIAIKQDVTEEIDRLHAHIQAARALLDSGGPVGRRLDFLAQEFNREANTLCSKAQSAALTGVGLDLKAAIDQMREQIQNVE